MQEMHAQVPRMRSWPTCLEYDARSVESHQGGPRSGRRAAGTGHRTNGTRRPSNPGRQPVSAYKITIWCEFDGDEPDLAMHLEQGELWDAASDVQYQIDQVTAG